MKWPKRPSDNPTTLGQFLAFIFLMPIAVFIGAYLLSAGMMWLVATPLMTIKPVEMAIWTTIATTFFLWILGFMMYFGPGEAQMREDRRQVVRRHIQAYLDRYPDSKMPIDREFME